MERVFGDGRTSALRGPSSRGRGHERLCREFGISRKTGYKIFNRYKEQGLEALYDRSRRPVRYANQLPDQVERLIVEPSASKPHWGARKIRELLVRALAGDVRLPAKSTVHAVLDRHGLVRRAPNAPQPGPGHAAVVRRRPQRAVVRRLQGRVQARQRPILLPADRVPTRLRASFSLCEALESTREHAVFEAFQRLFTRARPAGAIR